MCRYVAHGKGDRVRVRQYENHGYVKKLVGVYEGSIERVTSRSVWVKYADGQVRRHLLESVEKVG